MKNSGIIGRVRREGAAAPKVMSWLLAAVLLGVFLFRTDQAATSGLFQSPPESPLATPTLVPTDVPTAVPTETTAPVTTAVPTDAGLTETAVPESSPTPALPTQTATTQPFTATPTPTATATVPPIPTATLAATAIPSATSAPTLSSSSGGDRYAEGESNLLFDWNMLVDSLALGLSYAWLCCGVIVLFGLAAFFLVLWAASRRREPGEE